MKLHKYEQNHEQDRRFDEAVRQRMAEDRATPPAGLWERVAGELDSGPPHQRVDARWWGVAAAVSLLIVGGIGIGLYLGASQNPAQTNVRASAPGAADSFLPASPAGEPLASAGTPSSSQPEANRDAPTEPAPDEHSGPGKAAPDQVPQSGRSSAAGQSSPPAQPVPEQPAPSRDAQAAGQPRQAHGSSFRRSELPAMKASANSDASASRQVFERNNTDTLHQHARKLPRFHLIAVERLGPVAAHDSLASLAPDSLTGSDVSRGVREAGGMPPQQDVHHGRHPSRRLPHIRANPHHHDTVKGVGR